jgi:hypothetical protein
MNPPWPEGIVFGQADQPSPHAGKTGLSKSKLG